jgi:8-oxo-dGTP pyrophosphatase MutT (NUDIX family)
MSTHTTKKKRFLYNGNKSKQINAVGVLFVKYDYDSDSDSYTYNFLTLTNKNSKNPKLNGLISDIGGKVEEEDTSPINTLARELFEETNGSLYYTYQDDSIEYLSVEKLQILIANNKIKIVYNESSKYLLYFVKFPSTLSIDIEQFGDVEELTGIIRELNWYTSKDLLKTLHFRLRNKTITDTIKNIKTIF